MRAPPFVAQCLGLCLVAASPALAQASGDMHVNMNLPDSIAHVIPRAGAERAHYAITSRDGKTMLLLMDTTIVAQLTDRGLAALKSPAQVDTISDATSKFFAKMVLGALQPVFDHGIAYHLRDMASATYADGRLQIRRTNGDEVFKGVEFGHEPMMTGFAPDDAKAFARMATDARKKLH